MRHTSSDLAQQGGFGQSDVDVALLFGETDTSNQLEITGRLSEDLCQTLGGIKVDAVNLGEVPTHFAYEILRTGNLVFCANSHQRIRFETDIIEKTHGRRTVATDWPSLSDEASKNEADVKEGEGHDRSEER